MPEVTNNQQPKLLDEVRHALRLRHYSIRTDDHFATHLTSRPSCGKPHPARR